MTETIGQLRYSGVGQATLDPAGLGGVVEAEVVGAPDAQHAACKRKHSKATVL